jgi:hypothetical protein
MMKFGTVNLLGFQPAAGPAEANLPANWQGQIPGYALDRWRQYTLTGGVEYYIGRTMLVPPEARALQLRPDGLRGALEVGLIFHPKDEHEKTFGSCHVVARAGQIIELPWAPHNHNANRVVEVYPVMQADVAAATEGSAHYAKFAFLEETDIQQASKYTAPETAEYKQADAFVLPANDRLTAKAVPQLDYVPCKGMRQGLLTVPPAASTNDAAITNGYFVSVWCMDPYPVNILPLAYVRSGHASRKEIPFAIPPNARALQVRAWRHTAAKTITPTTDDGIQLFMSPLPQAIENQSRASGIALLVPQVN